MNRRSLLRGFLALPVGIGLAKWSKPGPVNASTMFASMLVAQDGSGDFTTLVEALKHAAPGAVIFIKAGHSETISEPLAAANGDARVIGLKGGPRPVLRFGTHHA